jgi:phosphinothricin acetyltransferase
MNGNIVFTEMKDEYIPAVLEIYNYYILNSTATFHTEPLNLTAMREILYPYNERFKSYAMMDGETVCGYCILAPFKKREAYDTTAEATIYLKQGYAGKGHGSMALSLLEKQALQNEFHTLLAVICGENGESIRLFEKAGYEKCAHYREVGRKFGRFLDVVCYQKIL